MKVYLDCKAADWKLLIFSCYYYQEKLSDGNEDALSALSIPLLFCLQFQEILFTLFVHVLTLSGYPCERKCGKPTSRLLCNNSLFLATLFHWSWLIFLVGWLVGLNQPTTGFYGTRIMWTIILISLYLSAKLC